MTLILTILTWLLLGLCFYIYIGYPLIVYVLANFFKNPVARSEDYMPSLSLIIAAYNEASVLERKILNSLELDYPKDALQIIVVSDGSSDATPTIASEFENKGIVNLYDPTRRGKSAAINRAVEQATGDILVFSDANAYYQLDALHKLVRNFNDANVGCVSGRKTVVNEGAVIGESEGLYWKYESFIKKNESKFHSCTGVVGEILAIRRNLMTPIPESIINDDAYMAWQVLSEGQRVIYEAEAVSWEHPSVSASDDAVRRRRMNAGRYQLFAKTTLWKSIPPKVLFELLSHKFLRLMLPFFMIGAFLTNGLVILLPDSSLLLVFTFIAQVLFYTFAIIGKLDILSGKAGKLAKVAFFLVNGNIAAIDGFIYFMRGKQSVLWQKAERSTSE